MRLLNPLQWNFGPRTTATLLTWAIIPLALSSLIAWRGLSEGATRLGLTAEQFQTLTGSMIRDLLIVNAGVLVVCLAAAVYFSWLVVQPLWRLRKAMERITQGDLSEPALPVGSRDELGQMTDSFNSMASALHNMVQEMAVTADELEAAGRVLHQTTSETAGATAESARQIEQVRRIAKEQAEKAGAGARSTGELREAAEQVARASEAQAREVEHAASTVHEVAAAIDQVASSAGVVARSAVNTREAADGGGKAVHALMQGMERVRERVLHAAGDVRELSGNLSHVDEILQLITEIADQTDLLALNAAIEAARVGEHGKGFAVVAGEVRRLAERSRRAAADIASRVDELRSRAQVVVTAMEAGTQEVQNGAVLAKEAGAALAGILGAVAETQRQVESISAASEQISAASTQVVDTTQHLSAIAEENAATAEQMLASATGVTHMIEAVLTEANEAKGASTAMAAAGQQVRSGADSVVACAGQVAATATKLRANVSRFRLK